VCFHNDTYHHISHLQPVTEKVWYSNDIVRASSSSKALAARSSNNEANAWPYTQTAYIRHPSMMQHTLGSSHLLSSTPAALTGLPQATQFNSNTGFSQCCATLLPLSNIDKIRQLLQPHTPAQLASDSTNVEEGLYDAVLGPSNCITSPKAAR